MEFRILIAAAVVAAGACSGPGGNAAPEVAPIPEPLSDGPIGAPGAPTTAPHTSASPAGRAPGVPGAGQAAATPAAPTTRFPAVLGGTKQAPPPPEGGDVPDTFDRRAHLPDGARRVASGRSSVGAEWRLYAYREEGKRPTCVLFASQTSANGGGGGSCDQSLPIDASMSISDHGRFVYGLASPEVVRVRVEHHDGLAETLGAAGTAGYTEHFFAGEVAATPLKRIVGLDASGGVVAVKDDMESYNAPSGGF